MTRMLSLEVEDSPGQLGRVARLLAEGGINIELVNAQGGTLLLIVDDVGAAIDLLRAGGHRPTIEECLEVGLPNLPGELAALGEALGAAGVNIVGVFGGTSDGRMQVRVDDLRKAKPALERFGPVRIPVGPASHGR